MALSGARERVARKENPKGFHHYELFPGQLAPKPKPPQNYTPKSKNDARQYLMRQLAEARYGNTGQVFFGAPDEVSEPELDKNGQVIHRALPVFRSARERDEYNRSLINRKRQKEIAQNSLGAYQQLTQTIAQSMSGKGGENAGVPLPVLPFGNPRIEKLLEEISAGQKEGFTKMSFPHPGNPSPGMVPLIPAGMQAPGNQVQYGPRADYTNTMNSLNTNLGAIYGIQQKQLEVLEKGLLNDRNEPLMNSLRAQIAENNTAVSQLNAKSDTNNAALQAKLTEMTGQIEAANAAIGSLNTGANQAFTGVGAVLTDITTRLATLERENAKGPEVTRQMDVLKKALEEVKTPDATVTAKVKELTDAASSLQAASQAVGIAEVGIAKQNAAVLTALSGLQTDVTALSGAVTGAQQVHSAENEVLRQALVNLPTAANYTLQQSNVTQQLSRYNTAIEAIQGRLRDLNPQNQEAAAEVVKMQNLNDVLASVSQGMLETKTTTKEMLTQEATAITTLGQKAEALSGKMGEQTAATDALVAASNQAASEFGRLLQALKDAMQYRTQQPLQLQQPLQQIPTQPPLQILPPPQQLQLTAGEAMATGLVQDETPGAPTGMDTSSIQPGIHPNDSSIAPAAFTASMAAYQDLQTRVDIRQETNRQNTTTSVVDLIHVYTPGNEQSTANTTYQEMLEHMGTLFQASQNPSDPTAAASALAFNEVKRRVLTGLLTVKEADGQRIHYWCMHNARDAADRDQMYNYIMKNQQKLCPLVTIESGTGEMGLFFGAANGPLTAANVRHYIAYGPPEVTGFPGNQPNVHATTVAIDGATTAGVNNPPDLSGTSTIEGLAQQRINNLSGAAYRNQNVPQHAGSATAVNISNPNAVAPPGSFNAAPAAATSVPSQRPEPKPGSGTPNTSFNAVLQGASGAGRGNQVAEPGYGMGYEGPEGNPMDPDLADEPITMQELQENLAQKKMHHEALLRQWNEMKRTGVEESNPEAWRAMIHNVQISKSAVQIAEAAIDNQAAVQTKNQAIVAVQHQGVLVRTPGPVSGSASRFSTAVETIVREAGIAPTDVVSGQGIQTAAETASAKREKLIFFCGLGEAVFESPLRDTLICILIDESYMIKVDGDYTIKAGELATRPQVTMRFIQIKNGTRAIGPPLNYNGNSGRFTDASGDTVFCLFVTHSVGVRGGIPSLRMAISGVRTFNRPDFPHGSGVGKKREGSIGGRLDGLKRRYKNLT